MFRSKPSCEINFTNDNKNVFYTNEKVSNVVILNNEKSRKLTSINIEFLGNAKVKFYFKEDEASRAPPTSRRGKEILIEETKNLWTCDNGSVLPEGVHKFNFSFYIPFKLPTSIESDYQHFLNKDTSEPLITYKAYGYIRYMMVVKLDNNDKNEFSFEFPITIIKNRDLNFESESLRQPVKYQDLKKFTFSTKSILMRASIPTGAYVCGERVKIDIEIENDSSVDIKAIIVELRKVYVLISNEPKKSKETQIVRKTVASNIIEGLPGKEEPQRVEAFLDIPSVPPSSEKLCSILDLSYELHVIAKFKGPHLNFTLKMPIVVGTVPFVWENDDRLPVNAGASNAEMEGPKTPEAYDNIPPPSYFEAVGATSEENSSQALHFTPSYPVFNFPKENL